MGDLEHWLDGEEFYNAMQLYRFAPIHEPKAVRHCFELVKQLIISNISKQNGEAMNNLDERLRREVLCDLIKANSAIAEALSAPLIAKRHIDEGIKALWDARTLLVKDESEDIGNF